MIDIIFNILQILFWFIIILVPLVVIHEFGHLIFARLFGVKIPEFGIGLPLTNHKLTKKFKGINWSIYPWLLGGFVRIYGDHDELDDHFEMAKIDPIKAKESYKEKRVAELLANNTVDSVLKDNFIDYDDGWKWFSNTAYISDEEINDSKNKTRLLKQLLAGVKKSKSLPIEDLDYDKNAFVKNPKTYISSLSQEQSQNISDKLIAEYSRLKNLLKTLVEWEFDSKVIGKNKIALKEAFFSKNIIAKFFIISGGVIFNFITAIVLFMISFSILGTIPETFTIDRQPILGNQIEEYQKDYKVDVLSEGLIVNLAEESALGDAGLESGDQIISIGERNISDNRIESLEDLSEELEQYDNQEVQISYLRDGNTKEADVFLEKSTIDDEEKVRLGAYVGYEVKRYSKGFFSILPDAIKETSRITGATFKGIGDIILALFPGSENRSALQSVAGPIGVGYASGQIFDFAGLSGIVYLMAIVSIALAVFNMLPVPALDGGRLLLIIINRITKRRFKNLESIAISVTFLLLILVAILVAGVDIQRIINR